MPRPETCPSPLCILDMPDPSACEECPNEPKPHLGWGGKRPGAGAPVANLNRLLHGGQSRLLKRGIERMCDDPEMRAVLHIIARLATEGSVPPQTKRTVQAIMNKKGVASGLLRV